VHTDWSDGDAAEQIIFIVSVHSFGEALKFFDISCLVRSGDVAKRIMDLLLVPRLRLVEVILLKPMHP
jgi:hypothetical protein